MTKRFTQIKYSLYNSESFQAASDDEDSDNSCSNLNSKYLSRKIQFNKELQGSTEGGSLAQNLEENLEEDLSQVSVQHILRENDVVKLEAYLNDLSSEACFHIVNHLDGNKLGPLHYAARYNLVLVLKLLLRKGADPNIKGENGLTPLHFAARYGFSKASKYLADQCSNLLGDDCKKIVQLLLEKGAQVNIQDIYGMTALHYAAIRGNTAAIEELLKSIKINTEVSDKQEMTALHCAANYCSDEVVPLLLNANANPEATDENLSTPLHLAATTGSKEIILLLLEAVEKNSGVQSLKMYIEDKNLSNKTALHIAISRGYQDIVEVLLNKGADVKTPLDNKSQPLHLAAISGNVDIVKLLIEHGAEHNCINKFGETPLHKAAAYNSTEVIEFLLKNGADLERRDNSYFTPLLSATEEGHVEAIKMLLNYHADINVTDNMDRTVIFWAVQENNFEALKVFLENNRANNLVNRCDYYYNSPLHIAALKGFCLVAQILLENHADIRKKNENEQTPLHLAAKNGQVGIVQLLIKCTKTIVNSEDENTNTPLHLAALSGNYRVINALLNAGANIEARNCYLWTPLFCAASQGWKRCCLILLSNGSFVDSLDKSKATPLHLAANEGHRGVVKLLLKFGASISHCDKNGKNCLDLAIDKGYEDVTLEILSDPKWKEVLRNESDDNKFSTHQTPLRRLIQKMPDVACFVLNQCISKNESSDDDKDFEVTFNYEFLDDMFVCYKPNLYDVIEEKGVSSHSESSVNIGSNVYEEDGSIKSKTPPYTYDREILQYNHPLWLMVSHGRGNLLKHPLCESLLRRKWKYYGRYVYYSNLFIYVLFLIFLTAYVLTSLPPCPIIDNEGNSDCCYNNSTCPPFIGNCDIDVNRTFLEMCSIFIYALAGLNILKEVFQLYQNGKKYLNLENFLEWICYISALIFITDLTNCSSETGIREVWQWELGAFSIFSAWMVLLLLISKFPFLGIYVVMFFQILTTFMYFSLVCLLFIIAFALVFHCLLPNQNRFETMGKSLIKTGVMMIGDIDFDSIFNEPKYNKVYFQIPTYALFVAFMVILAIIVMNLLVGLAVDDIKGIQEEAELKRLAMKVDLVLTVERILPVVVLRKCIYRFRKIYPNTSKLMPWYIKCLKVRHQPIDNIFKSTINEEEDKQVKLIKQVKKLQDSIQQIQKDLKNIMPVSKNKS